MNFWARSMSGGKSCSLSANETNCESKVRANFDTWRFGIVPDNMAERAFMVRAGNDNELVEEFESRSLVAVGWKELGDVSDIRSYEDMKIRFNSTDEYSQHNSRRLAQNAGQVNRFALEMKEGHLVLSYDKTEREYLIGEVTSGYEWKPGDHPPGYPHVRRVEWKDTVSRDEFTTSTKNTLGSTLTVFSLDDCIDEITDVLSGETPDESEDEEDTVPFVDEVENQADELISDILANMDPFVFEELVAAVLRAMGYHAKKTRDSQDRGIDVVAHPDSLGFEEPYIKAQVKRQQKKVGSPDMRAFTGTLGNGERGLFVSTGGYTSEAQDAARNAEQRVTLIDRDEFIDLLIQHYDDLESEYQATVPLKQIYIPSQDPPLEE
ncbi:restriction endonuclease [Halarchaeum nitratireducens]|uniref:Restriction endonuclease n=2 Tax=Halarchaeum nitratireducens TaxID=489913 RepID=A0A830G8I4_9EURY|nr:restriction endonuclease [Halarchaeum nitratireducens]